MDSETFSVKEYDKIIDDIIDEFFEEHNINYDLKELMKTNLLGNEVNGSETGEIIENKEVV